MPGKVIGQGNGHLQHQGQCKGQERFLKCNMVKLAFIKLSISLSERKVKNYRYNTLVFS